MAVDADGTITAGIAAGTGIIMGMTADLVSH
jgi:hypothetical protein